MKKKSIILFFLFTLVFSTYFLFDFKTTSAQICTVPTAGTDCWSRCGAWTGFSCPSGVVSSPAVYVNGVCSRQDSCNGICEWQGKQVNTTSCQSGLCQYNYSANYCGYPNVWNCQGGYYQVPDTECGGGGGGIPGATFSVGLNPASSTLYETQTKDFTVTATSDGRTITLTKSCPAGTTCTFISESGMSVLNAQGDLEFTFNGYARAGYLRAVGNTAGSYNLTITGTIGAESHPVSSLLNVLAVTNHASCVSITTNPVSPVAGSTFSATVVMQNDGTKIWNSDATPHKLGATGPLISDRDNMRWGLNRVVLPSLTNTGSPATFNFNATAPATPGTYSFDWEMVEDGLEWFSTISPSNLGGRCVKTITVANAAIPAPDLKVTGGSYVNVDGPIQISSGSNYTLSWGAVANAVSCTLDGVAVSKDGGTANKSASLSTQTNTLVCTNSTGQTGSDSVTVATLLPVISVTPASLTFTTYWGATALQVPFQSLRVQNTGNDTLTWDSTNEDEPRIDNHPYEYCYYKMYTGVTSKTLAPGESQNINVRVVPPNPTFLGIAGVIPGPGVYNSCFLHFTDVNGKAAPVDVPIIYDLGMTCPIGDESCNVYNPSAVAGGTCLTPNIKVSWEVPSVLTGPGFGVNIYRKDLTVNGPLTKIVTNLPTTNTSYTDLTPPLIKDHTYYYEIEAGYNISGANPVISPNRIRTNDVKNACTPIDLTAIGISPTTAIVNQSTNFSSDIRNIGTDPVGFFTNVFQTSSNSDGSNPDPFGAIYPIMSLAGGASENITRSFTFSTVGTKYMRVCADKRFDGMGNMIDGSVAEALENNNCTAWTPINVITTATANITANNFPGPITLTNNGDPVTIRWDYSNASSCTLDPALASITAFPGGNGTFTVPSLTASRTYSISCSPVGSGSSDSVVVNVPAASKDLTVIKSGQGVVTSTSVPNQASQINCGAGCPNQTVGFEPNAAIKLTESPAPGRIFTGWSGVSCSEGNQKSTTCSFTMGVSNLTVIANFAVDPNYKEF